MSLTGAKRTWRVDPNRSFMTRSRHALLLICAVQIPVAPIPAVVNPCCNCIIVFA